MKRDEIKRKLSLNKKTITDLNEDALERVKGGLPDTYYRTCSCYCSDFVTVCGSQPCC